MQPSGHKQMLRLLSDVGMRGVSAYNVYSAQAKLASIDSIGQMTNDPSQRLTA